MKIGIYGGTFDPIHFGHLITARFILETRELDKLIFIPCYISPHKVHQFSSNENARLEMLRLATKDEPRFEISEYELENKEISYTVKTLEHFSNIYEEIELIIGYDNLLVFPDWKEPDRIFELATVVVLKRKTDLNQRINKYFELAEFVESPVIEISSTDIRNRVHNDISVKYLLPDSVIDYIKENNLYR